MDYPVIFPESGDYVVDIPFPYEEFTDTQFFLTETSQGQNLFIPDDCYTRIDDKRISFSSHGPTRIVLNDLRFTFIYSKQKRWIGKTEYHLSVKEIGQREFFLPDSPYNKLVDIKKRTYVFYNRRRQTRGTDYLLDSSTGKITLINKKLKGLIGDRLDILIIHTGSNNNGGIQELPQSGYIELSKNEIDRNYNPNLMAVFVNGLLIDKDKVIQMTNTKYKIGEDIGSRYNLEIKNLSPRLNSMMPYYKQHIIPKDPPQSLLKKEFYCRIEIPRTEPYGRRVLKPMFNPVYFSPELLDNPDLWINLILKKSDVNYELKFYGDDYTEYPTELNIIIQLRRRAERNFAENSRTATIVAKLPSIITPLSKDYVVFSIQVKTILNMDTYNEKYPIDGIIGRFQADVREFPSINPIYFELTSNGLDYETVIKLFQWSVSTEQENKGDITWIQDFDLEPNNKLNLLEGVDNSV